MMGFHCLPKGDRAATAVAIILLVPLLAGSAAAQRIESRPGQVRRGGRPAERQARSDVATTKGKWVTLFQDDFDSGKADASWSLETGWDVEMDNRDFRNFVLTGMGRAIGRKQARLTRRQDWTDFSLKFRMKILIPGVRLNYRKSRAAWYSLALRDRMATLRKVVLPGAAHEQASSERWKLGAWHDFELRVVGANTKLFVDDELRLDTTDDRPLARGAIAFETQQNTHVHIDDIVVAGAPFSTDLKWENLRGPMGGLGYDVRIDPVNPEVMYVTDNLAGVLKSTDGGDTWRGMNEGITARRGPSGDAIPIFCLTIDPTDHNVLWAGTADGVGPTLGGPGASDVRGVFKSTDGGRSWNRKNRGIAEDRVFLRSFTIDPKNSSIVYCGAEIGTGDRGWQHPKRKGRIYKTRDGGENWSTVWAGDSLVRHIIIDPTDSSIVYAATGIFDREAYNSDVRKGEPGGVGVLKSTDGGRTWPRVNNGLDNLYVGYLAMHPTDHLILYAATGNYATKDGPPQMASGLYVTRDGAQSWSSIRIREDHFPFTAVRFSHQNPLVVYAGTERSIWRSDDGGATWDSFGHEDNRTYGPRGVRAGMPIDLTIDPRDPLHIYANNYIGGVIQSNDGGKTWRDSSTGYSGAQLLDLAISPSGHNDLYVAGKSGLYRSSDGGRSWKGIRDTGPKIKPILKWYAIEIAPDNSESVFATSQGQGIILHSTDGGAEWQMVFRARPVLGGSKRRDGFKALRFAPSDPSTIYAGTCFRFAHLRGPRENRPSHGIYVSRYGGSRSTWRERNNGLKDLSGMNIHDIAVHPTKPGTAYAATNDSGVFVTADYGETWRQVIRGLLQRPRDLSVRALAIDPQNPNRIYAGVAKGGIYVSTDAGETWRLISAGMDPYASIYAIAINPANPKVVVAGDWHSGVYHTSNGTAPWTPANEGLSMRAVASLAYSRGGGVLYAATEGGGLFRAYPDSDKDGLPDIKEDRNDDGLRQPGETDPHVSDTDGDGLSDAADSFPTDPERK